MIPYFENAEVRYMSRCKLGRGGGGGGGGVLPKISPQYPPGMAGELLAHLGIFTFSYNDCQGMTTFLVAVVNTAA